MTDAVLALVCQHECLAPDVPQCDICVFYDLCGIGENDDVKEWLESEVEDG